MKRIYMILIEAIAHLKPDARDARHESLFDRLRTGRSVKAMTVVATLSAMLWLTGCGDNTSAKKLSDGGSENGGGNSGEVVDQQMNDADYGPDVELKLDNNPELIEEAIKIAGLNMVQTVASHHERDGGDVLKDEDFTGEPGGENELVEGIFGSPYAIVNDNTIFSANPEDIKRMMESKTPFSEMALVEEEYTEGVFLHVNTSADIGSVATGFRKAPFTEARLEINSEEGLEMVQSAFPSNQSQIPEFREFLLSEEAQEIFDPHYVALGESAGREVIDEEVVTVGHESYAAATDPNRVEELVNSAISETAKNLGVKAENPPPFSHARAGEEVPQPSNNKDYYQEVESEAAPEQEAVSSPEEVKIAEQKEILRESAAVITDNMLTEYENDGNLNLKRISNIPEGFDSMEWGIITPAAFEGATPEEITEADGKQVSVIHGVTLGGEEEIVLISEHDPETKIIKTIWYDVVGDGSKIPRVEKAEDLADLREYLTEPQPDIQIIAITWILREPYTEDLLKRNDIETGDWENSDVQEKAEALEEKMTS